MGFWRSVQELAILAAHGTPWGLGPIPNNITILGRD